MGQHWAPSEFRRFCACSRRSSPTVIFTFGGLPTILKPFVLKFNGITGMGLAAAESPEGSGNLPDAMADTFASNLEICYEILLYLASRMIKLKRGECFEFITSDADAAEKIESWCDLRGFTLLEIGHS